MSKDAVSPALTLCCRARLEGLGNALVYYISADNYDTAINATVFFRSVPLNDEEKTNIRIALESMLDQRLLYQQTYEKEVPKHELNVILNETIISLMYLGVSEGQDLNFLQDRLQQMDTYALSRVYSCIYDRIIFHKSKNFQDRFLRKINRELWYNNAVQAINISLQRAETEDDFSLVYAAPSLLAIINPEEALVFLQEAKSRTSSNFMKYGLGKGIKLAAGYKRNQRNNS